ncbi:hypothetical protein [Pseudomonas xantholysinigenes]|uniref:Uncharacterized protein n=1 Tax=Pseudomonas xantholysinigenes TaxID=2745490 RepID=A0A9E6Q1B9_9PSED|nr:hypothetical protein [Pseudomonas xantholysinigenes]QXI40527.1 hypothetical protein HU772_010830 [Pseudomonas xantholysinigenes]
MSTMMLTSSAFYGAALFVALGIAAVYCTRRQILPYHRVALARSWLDLDQRQQLLLLALVHLLGWAWVAIAFAGFILLYAWLLQPDQPGLVMALQALILLGTAPVIHVSSRVRRGTGASPPTIVSWIVLGLSLVGFLCAWPVWANA